MVEDVDVRVKEEGARDKAGSKVLEDLSGLTCEKIGILDRWEEGSL
ncbi:hypothetical protein [Siminovitchia fortis]|nr:hypothetical protein [Siminovitchia fortis]